MATNVVQSFALSGHIIEDTGNLVRVGPESAAQFLRVRDATVTYQVTTGGPTYTDTVPGLQAAVVYGSSPAVTTVDARLARYVTFITPAYGGVAPLQVATEGAYNFYAQQGYVIPLDICYLHHWNYYQNTGGVVLPPPGGSFSGGGTAGSFDSQSFSGQGQAGGLSFLNGGYNGSNNGTGLCAYLRLDSAVAAQTALLDMALTDSQTGGYFRLILRPDNSLSLDYKLLSSLVNPHGYCTGSYTLTTSVPLHQWVFISAGTYYDATPNVHKTHVNVGLWWTGGSATQEITTATDQDTATTYSAGLGIGHGVSDTVYTDFPNDLAHRLSKVAVYVARGMIGPFTSDLSGDTLTLMNREALGARTALADSSGGGHNAAGVFTLYKDGPYA